MYKYPDDFINKIICGDCLEVMKDIPDNSIDAVVTDPPYGLEFMGKEWDKFKKIEMKDFRDELSIKEYRISNLCQKCQDNTFGV